jgi:hypothetical protein
MALVKCGECGKEISRSATACPSCGAKQRRSYSLTKFAVIAIGVWITWIVISSNQKNDERQEAAAKVEATRLAAMKPEERAAEQKWAAEAKAFREQEYRNSERRKQNAVAVLDTVRSNLRNPQSVQWVSVASNDDSSLVCVKYRAQNGFGGMDVGYAVAVSGLVRMSDGAYNSNCAGKSLNDMADAANFASKYPGK